MIIDYIVGGIYLEMLEKGLITSMIINKSNNWLIVVSRFRCKLQ